MKIASKEYFSLMFQRTDVDIITSSSSDFILFNKYMQFSFAITGHQTSFIGLANLKLKYYTTEGDKKFMSKHIIWNESEGNT